MDERVIDDDASINETTSTTRTLHHGFHDSPERPDGEVFPIIQRYATRRHGRHDRLIGWLFVTTTTTRRFDVGRPFDVCFFVCVSVFFCMCKQYEFVASSWFGWIVNALVLKMHARMRARTHHE
jgi:hypothetical protein